MISLVVIQHWYSLVPAPATPWSLVLGGGGGDQTNTRRETMFYPLFRVF